MVLLWHCSKEPFLAPLFLRSEECGAQTSIPERVFGHPLLFPKQLHLLPPTPVGRIFLKISPEDPFCAVQLTLSGFDQFAVH